VLFRSPKSKCPRKVISLFSYHRPSKWLSSWRIT